ncbi:MAG: hypothetical protein KDD37_07285 [Bdellovibrionales bacterium]|nr:hypothetical protein [Bdellovibrionales bacterium]
MRYKILLVLYIVIAPLFAFSQSSPIKGPDDVRIYFEKTVQNIKSTKDNGQKIKTLAALRKFLRQEIEAKLKLLDSTYNESLEMENQLLATKNKSIAKEVQFVKSKLSLETAIYEQLNNYEYAFRNIFTYFVDRKRDKITDCEALDSSIVNAYLSTAPEGSILPTHAKLALELTQNLCSK